MPIPRPIPRQDLIEILGEDGATRFVELIPGTASSYYPEPIQKLNGWTTCSYCGRRNIENKEFECAGCGAPL